MPITLALLGSIGLSQVVERLSYLKSLSQEVITSRSVVTESVKDLQLFLEQPHFTLLPSRSALYAWYRDSITILPPGTRLSITHFEKFDAHFETGSVPELGEMSLRYRARVLAGELSVQQIVHVQSAGDLAAVQERLSLFGHLRNYELSVVTEPIDGAPFLDLSLAQDAWCMLVFSQFASAPRVADVAIALRDHDTLVLLQAYFALWFSKATVVKDRAGVSAARMAALSEQFGG